MKTLLQYIRDKYGYVQTALTRAEAIVLGIPYPLVKGWMQRYGHMEISQTTEQQLQEICAMDKRSARNKAARRLAAKEGLKLVGYRSQVMPADFVRSKEFYKSDQWRRARYLALKKAEGKCACCGATAATGATLHVDHVKPKSMFPDIALVVDNLQVLCADCNLGKSNRDITNWTPKVVK